jgi:hypothetical protein
MKHRIQQAFQNETPKRYVFFFNAIPESTKFLCLITPLKRGIPSIVHLEVTLTLGMPVLLGIILNKPYQDCYLCPFDLQVYILILSFFYLHRLDMKHKLTNQSFVDSTLSFCSYIGSCEKRVLWFHYLIRQVVKDKGVWENVNSKVNGF